ncbi:MAG: choice-of-anchor Q domain-containing protein [Bacteroidota bacterium]
MHNLNHEGTTYRKFEDLTDHVLFVDADAALGGDGTSWATAYKYLQDALANASSDNTITEIWVAEGVYYPDEDEGGNVTNNSESATFTLKNNLSVLGGFAGGENLNTQRNPFANSSILSGDIDQNDTKVNNIVTDPANIMGSNSTHVVTASNRNNTALLDGFTITGGNANANSGNNSYGGGLFAEVGSPTLRGIRFVGNTANLRGGGLYLEGENSNVSAILENLSFYNNYSASLGGGFYQVGGDFTLYNAIFSGNQAEFNGGAVYNDENSTAKYRNITFVNNTALQFRGGAIYNFASDIDVKNSIFIGNTDNFGSNSIFNSGGNGGSSVTHGYNSLDDSSLVGNTGAGNNETNISDPFVDIDGADNIAGTIDDDLQLVSFSDAIDSGRNSFNSTTQDIVGNARNFDDTAVTDAGSGTAPIIDRGALERQTESQPIIFVDADATLGGTGVSWGRAFKYLQDALATATTGDEIWVAEGVYYPDEDEAGNVSNNDESATFQLLNNISIFGGFNGSESTLDARAMATYPTILSGDIDQNDTDTNNDNIANQTTDIVGNNSFHVVTGSSTDATAILDGFIITAGQADGSSSNSNDNGAGVYNNSGAPSLQNLNLIGNVADNLGGGMFNGFLSPTLINLSFSKNVAKEGGGMANFLSLGSPVVLTNISFSLNEAEDGGAIYNLTASTNISNSIFYGNTANSSGNSIQTNGVNNTTISYSYFDDVTLPAGTTDGGNNLVGQANPFFNAANHNLRLLNFSNAIDAGNNNQNSTTEDLAGNPRKLDDGAVTDTGNGTAPIIDMGAFEWQSTSTNILYVNANAATNGDGTEWAKAYKYLQDALTEASTNSVIEAIWVAAGVYYPDEDEAGNITNNDERATFQLLNNVSLLGGFNGTESSSDERNPEANITILSGDIDKNDVKTNNIVINTDNISGDNSDHVVSGSGTDNTAIIDGFTITAGQALESDSDGDIGGGGMNNFAGSPSVNEIKFIGNYGLFGGGMNNEQSSPILTNVSFLNNSGDDGGGMLNRFSSSPILINVSFIENSARLGGGMVNFSSSPILINVSFSKNGSGREGGAMYNQQASPMLTNVSFSLNTGRDGGAIYNDDASPSIRNSIFYGNTASRSGNSVENDGVSSPSVSYSYFDDASLPSGTTDEGNNLVGQANPYVDAANHNLRLLSFSNAIDAGNNNQNSTTEDLAGNPRRFDDERVTDTGNGTAPIIDMGAFERQFPILYVNSTATAGGDGTKWDNAFRYLQDALAEASNNKNIQEIWVAAGTYYPDEDEAGNVTDNDESATFQLLNNVSVLGGFTGTESSSDERDPYANATILSGDIDNNDIKTDNVVINIFDIIGDNSDHIVTGSGTANTAVLDGFTITAGQADGSATEEQGGGMYNLQGSPSLNQLSFIGNMAKSGGAISNASSSSPVVTNILFSANSATLNGGAVLNDDNCSPIFTNIRFSANTAVVGGAVYNITSSSPTLTNVSFSANTATGNGGAIFNNFNSSPIIINASFSGNTGINGGAMYNFNSSTPNIVNSIFYGNTNTVRGDATGPSTVSFSYFDDASLPSGTTDGGNNLVGQVDPFVDAANGDLQLIDHSPAIDAGDNSQNSTSEDFAGNARNYDDVNVTDTGAGTAPIIDMGAFEKQSDSKLTPDVIAPADVTFCGGTTTTEISFSGTNMNTLYAWTNSNTQIGLAASGTGNIASFTATNATSNPISATITVTPYTVGSNGIDDGGTGDDCLGTSQTFMITVFNNAACANACTNNDLLIDENSTEAGIFQAVETITSDRIIAENTEVIFKAGTSITLQAGFHAEAGSNFTAQIAACPATLIASEPRNTSNKVETTKPLLPKVKVFPNPVRSYTNISIDLPEEQDVQVDIYDLNGRKITTIVPTTTLFAGTHTFEWSCDQVEAGIYFVVMNGQQVGRLAVIK